MKHRVYGKYLGRDKDERDRLFKSLVQSLFLHGTIITSTSKAKAIKGLVDKVINLAKEKHSQIRLESFITDKDLRDRLIKEIVPKLASRTSGYTSLIRLGQRFGDKTMMVRMSLIGAEELKPLEIGSRVKSPAGGEARHRRQESNKKPVKTATKRVTSITKSKQSVKRSKTGGKKS